MSRRPLAAVFLVAVASLHAPQTSRAAEPPAGLDALILAQTPAAATQNFFSTYDNTAHRYVRNSACFAARLDTTCVAVANSANADGTGGNRGCVTLVTPLHGLTNHHFGQLYQKGVVHYFVDRANTVYARTVVRSAQVGATDIEVVTFDAPLPAAVRPAPILPAGAAAKILPPGTPLLSTNQQKKAVITEFAGTTGPEIIVRPAAAANRAPWTATPPAVLGDSDSPTFVVLAGNPVLLFTYTTSVSGPAVSENIAGINALLSGGHTLKIQGKK